MKHRNRARTAPASCRFEVLESRRMLSAGSPDPFFGHNGAVSGSVGFEPLNTAIQADGKIVLIGTRDGHFAVARLNANGSLDRSFSGDGKLTTGFGGTASTTARAVAVQKDGKIVVVGKKNNRGGTAFTETEIAVARYNRNGSLDRTFSGDGRVLINNGEDLNASDVAIMPDGRIVIAGTSSDQVRFFGTEDKAAVIRLHANGSLDRSFGDRGLSTRRTGIATTAIGGETRGSALMLQPDGKIIVGGTSDERFALARYRTNGTLDRTFDDNGLLVTDFSQSASLNALALQPNGRIVAAGRAGGSFALVRYVADGTRDASFGTTGIVLTDFAKGDDRALSVVYTPDNKIIAGGVASGLARGQFAIARYRLDGTLDTTFGNDGKVMRGLGSREAVHTMRVTDDGKLLVAGKSGPRGAAARYFHFVPEVQAIRVGSTIREGGSRDGVFMIHRGTPENVTTRVYYQLGGSARHGVDYRSSASTIRRYVDIQPNRGFATITISPIDDAQLEATETVTLQLRDKDHYALGASDEATIHLRDNELVKVNFQQPTSQTPSGFFADTGQVFGSRGNGLTYGWDADNSDTTRDQDNPLSPDQSYDTYIHLQKDGADRTWEMAVPNGTYRVRLVSGDPDHTDGLFRLNAEGELAIDGAPSDANHWLENTVTVTVRDRRLTISNADGAINNKLNFIEVSSTGNPPPPDPFRVPIGTLPPPITAAGASAGGGATGAGSALSVVAGLFGDRAIALDELK